MWIQTLAVAAFAGLSTLPAAAQPLFANPLDSAAGYRAARGDIAQATHRFRYEVTTTETGKEPVVSNVTFDIAR